MKEAQLGKIYTWNRIKVFDKDEVKHNVKEFWQKS